MIIRKPEVILLIAATAVRSWGLLRAISRGEAAVYSWTTYLMGGLLVCSAVNVPIRSKRFALIAAGI